MASDGEWVAGKQVESPLEVYDQIASNSLKAASVQVNEKTLFYCLQPKEALPKEAARLCSANLSMRCNTCIKRIPVFAQLLGAEGKHVYLKEELDDANVKALRSMRNKIKSSEPADYHLLPIDEEFFQANPKEVGPFSHVHFLKEQVSDAQLSERLKKLKNYLNAALRTASKDWSTTPVP
ncbi:unnamed protein product [Effrenium voratum]|uniref:Uncharacterized protein n=1 Tax=Effrenium voratum TaxID=2562239 RepID=A0AA36J8S7_9DINO|nr:unnamed protein product [Effrenium voratum]